MKENSHKRNKSLSPWLRRKDKNLFLGVHYSFPLLLFSLDVSIVWHWSAGGRRWKIMLHTYQLCTWWTAKENMHPHYLPLYTQKLLTHGVSSESVLEFILHASLALLYIMCDHVLTKCLRKTFLGWLLWLYSIMIIWLAHSFICFILLKK